jgi:hypothetical protein
MTLASRKTKGPTMVSARLNKLCNNVASYDRMNITGRDFSAVFRSVKNYNKGHLM